MKSVNSAIRGMERLPPAGPWPTEDPFLFAVHHDDTFPAGNEQMGPKVSLVGHNLGADFMNKDGFNMYHGEVVPGFPKHPHRGFETVTIARSGFVDHSDSLGAAGRFGEGDVQWMTAGKGVEHSEMFPILNRTGQNHLELFQIWMNLPAKSKMVEPFFAMLWSEAIPHLSPPGVQVSIVSGSFIEGAVPSTPPACPPDSWAAQPGSNVGIVTIKLAPGASWTLPASTPGLNRSLYFFVGATCVVGSQSVSSETKIDLESSAAVELRNPASAEGGVVEFLLLEGKPIREPVVQHGPFVMNDRDGIIQAFQDHQRTQFGRWPWDDNAPVHDRSKGRFALFPDGHEEFPGGNGSSGGGKDNNRA